MLTSARRERSELILKAKYVAMPIDGKNLLVPIPKKAKDLRKKFNQWKNEADGLAGDEIFMVHNDSLLKLITQHGIASRYQGGGPVATGEQTGSSYISVLQKLAEPGTKLEEPNLDILTGLRKLMDGIANDKESILNPRNIAFQDPTRFNDAGITTDYEYVHGHYVTPNYVDRIDTRADALGNKFKGKVWSDSAPSSWYSNAPGTAKPPMWQALYGDGSGDGTFKGDSLLVIVKEMEEAWAEALEEGVGVLPKGERISIQADWKKALLLSEIYEDVEDVVDDIKANGRKSEYVTRTGALAWPKVKRDIEGHPINVEKNESDTAKDLADLHTDKIELGMLWVSVPRKQINQMVYSVMVKKGVKLPHNLPKLGLGNNALYLFKSLRDIKDLEMKARRKARVEKKQVKKSWRMMLKC